jgi:hypothetical protein
MSYYKAPNDVNPHSLDDDSFAHLLPAGSVKISEAEAAQMRADVAAKVDPQIAINAEALAYLASTDWYVIRQQETGEAVPADVLANRKTARSRVK